MTELELLHSFLQARLTDTEREILTLRERADTLNQIRSKVEDAIDREKLSKEPNTDPKP